MPDALVLHVTNVLGELLSPRTLEVSVGGAPLAVRQLGPGLYEATLPAAASTLRVEAIHSDDYWGIEGELQYTPGAATPPGPPPRVYYLAGQSHTNIHYFAPAHGRAAGGAGGATGWALEVTLVFGHLMDGAAALRSVANQQGAIPSIQGLNRVVSGPRQSQRIGLSPEPCLNDGATGWDRILLQDRLVPLMGQLYFVLHRTTPRIIALYRPSSVRLRTSGGTNTDTGYHVFFHPRIPAGWGTYPFGDSYLDLIWRYVVLHGGLLDLGNKTLAFQTEHSGRRAVLVFPLGSRDEEMGHLVESQARVHRLLKEIHFWLQRKEDSWPWRTFGRVALSGFSYGIRYVNRILTGARERDFWSDKLREIYNFDGAFADSHEEAVRRREDFQSAILQWAGSAPGDRRVRIYGQSGSRSGWSRLESIMAVPPAGIARSGTASTAHGTYGSVVHLSTDLWGSLFVEHLRAVGQLMPGRRPGNVLTPGPPFTEEEIRNRTRVIDPDRSTPGHPVLKDGLSVAYNWAHQIFPRLYLSHALEHSGFPR